MSKALRLLDGKLVSCHGNKLTKSFDLFDYRVSRSCPGKRSPVCVMILHNLINFGNQIFDASESSSPDCSLGDQIEADLDLIQPRSIGWRIVDLIPVG